MLINHSNISNTSHYY